MKHKFQFFISVFFLLQAFAAFSQSDYYAAAIVEGDEWKYHIPSQEPSTDWMQDTFDDSQWDTGPSGFGYGDNDDNTQVPAGTLSIYIRKTFNISDISEIEEALLLLDYDDGFVAYLNGVEIARSNISGTPPAYNQLANEAVEPLMAYGGKPGSNLIPLELLTAGSNILAIQIHNRGSSSSDMTAIPFLIFGLKNASSDYQDAPDWFLNTYGFETNLPILIIDTESNVIPDEPKTFASFTIIHNEDGSLNKPTDTTYAYRGFCGIELRGESSMSFPKKAYSIEMWDSLGNDIDTSFLNFPSEEDFVLNGPYSDKSLMNNVLGFHLANKMGNYASRTRYVELVVDDDYKGIYVLLERVKKDKARMDIAKLNPWEISGDDLTGGYIVRIDKGDDDGWYSQYGDYHTNNKLRIQYYYPDQNDIVDEQKEYIKTYFDDFEDAIFSADGFNEKNYHYTSYIDLMSFVDNFIINELSKNQDAYRLSTYYYKDKESNGGKLKAGYWDLNLGFGNINYCDGLSKYGWGYYTCPVGGYPVWWDLMLGDTLFTNALNCRWFELRETILHKDSINSYIDAFQAELQDAQVRNFNRWPIMGVYVWPNPDIYLKSSHEEVVLSLKEWISNRIDWMDQNMPGESNYCGLYDGPITITRDNVNLPTDPSEMSFTIYPNPAKGYTQIRSDELIEDLKLITVTGKVLYQSSPGTYEFGLNLNNIASGIYLVEITTRYQTVSQKIVVAR